MFKYNLHDIVEIEVIGTSTQIVEPEAQSSGPKAKIVGRAEYVNAGPSYLLRYTGADNQPVEAWWSEDALALALSRTVNTD